MVALSEDAVRTALSQLPHWELVGQEIVREFKFKDFPTAVAFVVRLGFAAEKVNHHPDLDIRYNRVRVALTTHDEGGVTQKDLDLAKQADEF